ncbi:MAG: DUF3341 domain-containing protein [bacterium]
MSKQFFLGIFEHEEDILDATRATRAAGHAIHDAYTPYAVHGLDEAMGLKSSRLTYACLAFAVFGLALGVFAQFWIGAIDWPVNVGGKPFNSLPAYLPVIFELTVLIGGLGVVFALFVRTRLFPGKKEQLVHPGVTNDRFVLALEERDASFNAQGIERLWRQFGLVEAKRVLV